jgi:hypothetical protein
MDADRVGGWAREPFTGDSSQRVSVWEKQQAEEDG